MEDDRALLKVPSARKAVRAQPAASEKRYFNSRVMVKGNWTREEDALLVQLVQDARSAGHAETDTDASGPRVTHWAEIAKNLPGRVGKQCRERWHNNLRPDLKKGEWSLAEEVMIFSCWRVWGPQWAKISRALEGRSDNRVKNHWNCHMKRRLEKDNEYVAVVTKTVEALDLVSALRDIMNVENSEKAFKDLISPQIVDYLRTNHHNELDSRTSSYVPRSTYVSPRKRHKSPRSPKRISTAKANSTGIGSFAASLLEKQQQKAAKRQQENKPDQCTTDLLEPVAKFSELSNGTDSAAADGYMDEDVPEEEFIEDMDEYRLPTKPPTVAFAPKTKQPVAKPRRTAPSPASARRPVFYRVRKSHSRQHYKTDDEPHAYAAISQAPPVLQLPSVNLLEQMQQASKMEAVEALIKLSTLTAPTTTAFVRRVDPVPAARDDVEELTDKSSGASEVKGDKAVRRGRPKRSEPEVVAKREEVRVEISSSGRPVRMKRGTVTDMLRAFDRDIDEALG